MKQKSTTSNKLQKPIHLGSHKIWRNRTSKAIVLPKMWVDINGVEFGDKVDITMETDGTLSVRKSSGVRS